MDSGCRGSGELVSGFRVWKRSSKGYQGTLSAGATQQSRPSTAIVSGGEKAQNGAGAAVKVGIHPYHYVWSRDRGRGGNRMLAPRCCRLPPV